MYIIHLTTQQMHHEFTAPCGVAAVYAHPVEHVLCNLTPLLLGPLLLGSHLLTTWLWLALVCAAQASPTACTTVHHRRRSTRSTATAATICHICQQRRGTTIITSTLTSILAYPAFSIGCMILRTSHPRPANYTGLLACTHNNASSFERLCVVGLLWREAVQERLVGKVVRIQVKDAPLGLEKDDHLYKNANK